MEEIEKMRRKTKGTLAAMLFAALSLTACGSAAENIPAEQPAETVSEELIGETEEITAETDAEEDKQGGQAADSDVLQIAKQGMFSTGGTVSDPVEGEYNPTTNWMDAERPGNTVHVDHANVFYQIPVSDNGNPIVYLHGYG